MTDRLSKNKRRPMRARIDLSTGGGLLAILLWSSTIALTRSLTEQLGSLTAGACVYGVGAALAFTGRVRTTRRQTESYSRPCWAYWWGCGSLFVLYTALLYAAVAAATDRTQVLEVGLLNYLWPALTLLLSIPLLGYRAGPWLIPGTLIALWGVLLVMTEGARVTGSSLLVHFQTNPMAYSLAATAALCWATIPNPAKADPEKSS